MMGSLPSRGKTLPSPSSDPSAQGRDPVALQAAGGFVSLGFCDPSQTSPPPPLNLGPPGTKESVFLLTSMLLSSPSAPAQARDGVRGKSKAAAVALGSFPAGRQAELSLRLGEPLTIVSEDGDWWTVLSEASGREYCIPSVHAARVSHGWLYEGLSREQAEELLLLPGNAGGAFLIRESQTRRGCYSLSVRLSRPASWDRIRHYRIQHLDNGWLYISPRLTFPSLRALVDHYSELADDICCRLKEPCALQSAGPRPGRDRSLPVTVQRAPLNWDQLDSSALFSDGSAATGQASLLSEGLRESLSSYMSLTDGSLDDAKAHSRGRKGNPDCST